MFIVFTMKLHCLENLSPVIAPVNIIGPPFHLKNVHTRSQKGKEVTFSHPYHYREVGPVTVLLPMDRKHVSRDAFTIDKDPG
jgi:hypothetical protein